MAYEHEIEQSWAKLRKEAVISPYTMTLMAMSGILAAVGLLTSSVPVLIGAMLVAPAFGPLALVAMALVLGRWRIAGRSFLAAVLGLALAVLMATATTWFLNVLGILEAGDNLLRRELLEERVRPGWYSVAAGLAAGTAGMLALVHNRTDTLVGTVASLALVPAGGAAGIALLSSDPARMAGGFALLGINVVLIIATAMMVLLAIGRGRPAGQERGTRHLRGGGPEAGAPGR